MNKSAMIRARIEEKLKEDVNKVFDKLGLSTTEAITLFYKQIKLHKGLPFSVKIPNKITKKVFEETDKKKNLIKAGKMENLFDKIEI
ncbi:type II toxin-antitoxin system antitoxin, RelB/DinJ family [Candidatus Falkowbacteria bacterium]|nr:MAG: type II toxin-antitoxin system antitoxin, RelB/DinJ family [Candidatus Falkowbacteria bacterium]